MTKTTVCSDVYSRCSMNSRMKKKKNLIQISSCYLPAAANISGGSWTKRTNLNYCEWKRQALCEIWSPVERREAPGDLGAQPTVVLSEHRYCNISHSQTYTLWEHIHTETKAQHTHTFISTWVIPKAFTTTSLTGEKKKERVWKSEKKHTLQNTQKASESTAQSCLSDAAGGAGFWIRTRWAPKHRCSLSIHLWPWGKEASLSIPFKNTTRDLFDHPNEGDLVSFFARGRLLLSCPQ